MAEKRRWLAGRGVLLALLALALSVGLVPAALAEDGGLGPTAQSVSVRDPNVVADSSMKSGQVVTWDCVWLGSYPQTEVAETDELRDADWADGDATVGGVRYRRITRDDATYSGYWPSGSGTYRYFRYEPIKWRVLKVDGDAALAVADVALDCRSYHESYVDVTWEASAVRSWLNGTGDAPYYTQGAQSGRTAQGFATVAFTAEQLGAVRQSSVTNANNTSSSAAGGNDTSDSVFLLSEAEVHGASATAHGFASDPDAYDEARRCKLTDYAHAMGAWVSTSGPYAGNCWWWLRSPGSNANNAAYMYGGGSVCRSGDNVSNGNNAVRPALNLDLSSPHLTWAGTVSSDGSVDESRPVTSVEVAGDALTYDGGEKTPPVTVWSNGTVVPDAGYEASYADNVDAGTATVTVTGKGTYAGSGSATFEISPASITSVTVSQASFAYDGKAKTPGVTVRAGSLEVPAAGYEASYANNVDAGTATVTVTGKGNFTGSKDATFEIAPAPTPKPDPTPAPAPTKTFPDVPADAWYAGVVGRAAGLGLINGYKDGRFGPNDNVTRGQVAVILWNMAGKPAPKGAAKSFPDVKSGKYYYDAVAWASSVGVVNGYKDGRFGPDDLVTREQLAAMLANYAGKVAGKDTSGSAADYKSMKDASKVSGWAAKSVGWCFKNGIISGTKQGYVNPQGNATRAETAKMVVFLHDLL